MWCLKLSLVVITIAGLLTLEESALVYKVMPTICYRPPFVQYNSTFYSKNKVAAINCIVTIQVDFE